MNKPKRARSGWRHGAWPAAIACTVVAAAASTACGQCQYEVTIIQAPECPPLGYPPTIGLSLNEHGHVVGYYFSCGIPADRPFLWTPEDGFQPLPMPDGAIEATASDINDEGVICGTALGPAIGQQAHDVPLLERPLVHGRGRDPQVALLVQDGQVAARGRRQPITIDAAHDLDQLLAGVEQVEAHGAGSSSPAPRVPGPRRPGSRP